eukprot:m.54760 g.54760  ORF g.54760 m.54760 type:complete len:374 (-) comp18549_c0_seq1:35-1156(-)
MTVRLPVSQGCNTFKTTHGKRKTGGIGREKPVVVNIKWIRTSGQRKTPNICKLVAARPINECVIEHFTAKSIRCVVAYAHGARTGRDHVQILNIFLERTVPPFVGGPDKDVAMVIAVGCGIITIDGPVSIGFSKAIATVENEILLNNELIRCCSHGASNWILVEIRASVPRVDRPMVTCCPNVRPHHIPTGHIPAHKIVIKIYAGTRTTEKDIVHQLNVAANSLKVSTGLLAIISNFRNKVIVDSHVERICWLTSIHVVGTTNKRNGRITGEPKDIKADGTMPDMVAEKQSVASSLIKSVVHDGDGLSSIYKQGSISSNGPIATGRDFVLVHEGWSGVSKSKTWVDKSEEKKTKRKKNKEISHNKALQNHVKQ